MIDAAHADSPAVAAWSFDGNLDDRSGHGNQAFATTASFVPGHKGQGLRCGAGKVVVHDSPPLRPGPGLRIDCWVKLDDLGTSYQPILLKDRAYQLRLDGPQEGSKFSFFLHLEGWEPRVRSKQPAKPGQWYHLAAGWDGKEIWIEVDGERTSAKRAGTPILSSQPLELGLFAGVLDELRIENPAAPLAGIGQWLFEGDLRDASGHGNQLSGKQVEFATVPGGKALKSGPQALKLASNPDLQLAPGFRIDCSVRFDALPPDGRRIVFKNNEYQLRLESQKEGGTLAFFVNTGTWGPRITSDQRISAGQWYRISASWDGFLLKLEVNGQQARVTRSGMPVPTDNPLLVGGFDGLIDNLVLENPRLPTLHVKDAKQEHAILLAERVEKFTTTIRNFGAPAEHVVARLTLPAGRQSPIKNLGQQVFDLGSLPTGAEKTIEWSIQADSPLIGAAEIALTADRMIPIRARHPLVIFGSEDGPPPSASAKLRPSENTQGTIWYIDSFSGNNANAGTSPGAAWKDFTNINGKALGPGDRLMLKRGSVFNQELSVSARGTPENWAEIGAYGQGPRPIIRRNWDIDERCALVKNPDFLRIRHLVLCYAGKGLIVNYSEPGHRALLIEDCIAHHIEGLYRFNSHGIPEWLDRRGAQGDSGSHSYGIGITGAPASDLVLRDCEMFQCSSGYFMHGDDAVVERVFCHDNFVHNTSPHPFFVSTRRAILKNSVFDASGWHASAGTMGIMLGDIHGLIIRNCYFRNQPDSGSHDEGGIDFENRGNGCLIDRCTFENNAGAAIEVLGLKSPQTTNIEIRNSRFIKNNTANKLGPGEIFVWGRTADPLVCRSNGLVTGNGYVLLPDVKFFVNEAPRLTDWTLRDNTQYSNATEIERAMPYNRPPVVDAGQEIRSDEPTVHLAGSVKDDGLPVKGELGTVWEVLEGPNGAAGPAEVRFADPHAPVTKATFDQTGDYLLRLMAHDGQLWTSDMVAVHILAPGTKIVAAWEFNKNMDKEGWSEARLGTQIKKWLDKQYPTTSHPVHHVAGGFYTVAIENSTDAHLLSTDSLGIPMTGHEKVVLKFQNHTPATQMRLRYVTDADSTWDDAKSRSFAVTPNDAACRTYSVELPAVKQGTLKQLRLDLATGTPLTGTCRIDYVWVMK